MPAVEVTSKTGLKGRLGAEGRFISLRTYGSRGGGAEGHCEGDGHSIGGRGVGPSTGLEGSTARTGAHVGGSHDGWGLTVVVIAAGVGDCSFSVAS